MPFILLALVVVALVSASSAKGAAAGTAEPPALFSPGERAYSRVHGTEVIVGRAAYGALGWKYKALPVPSLAALAVCDWPGSIETVTH